MLCIKQLYCSDQNANTCIDFLDILNYIYFQDLSSISFNLCHCPACHFHFISIHFWVKLIINSEFKYNNFYWLTFVFSVFLFFHLPVMCIYIFVCVYLCVYMYINMYILYICCSFKQDLMFYGIWLNDIVALALELSSI